MSESNTVRDELNGYITELTQVKHQLSTFQTSNHAARDVYADQAVVLSTAIDGLLTKLSPPSLAEHITLDGIVEIVDQVTNTIKSATLFLQLWTPQQQPS